MRFFLFMLLFLTVSFPALSQESFISYTDSGLQDGDEGIYYRSGCGDADCMRNNIILPAFADFSNLTDPNVDNLTFWDDSDGAYEWLDVSALAAPASFGTGDKMLVIEGGVLKVIDYDNLPAGGGSFDSTSVDATTWSDGANTSNIWTFDVSGTDHTMTAGNGVMTFGDSVTVTDILTTPTLMFSGTGVMNGLDAIDGTTEATLEAALDIAGDITGTGLGSVAITTGAIVNADINGSAAIALSKLATDPLARANHTGTQVLSTISDAGALASEDTINSSALIDVGVITLSDIGGAALSGSDATLVTGTAGSNGHCAQWNADGDLVTSGDTCGSGGSGIGGSDTEVQFNDSGVLSGDNAFTFNSGTDTLTVTNIAATLTGNADTATALASNGSNCSSGSAPLGVNASGVVESCFDVWTEAENTSAAYISAITGEDEGSELNTNFDTVDCVGSGITCTDGGSGVMTVTVAGGSAPVDSVNGETGVVVLDTSDIGEGASNFYVRSGAGTTSYEIGTGADAQSTDSIAIGNSTIAGNGTTLGSIAIGGINTSVTGQYSVGIGAYVDIDATSTNAVYIGNDGDMNGAFKSIGIGDNTTVEGDYSVAIGDFNDIGVDSHYNHLMGQTIIIPDGETSNIAFGGYGGGSGSLTVNGSGNFVAKKPSTAATSFTGDDQVTFIGYDEILLQDGQSIITNDGISMSLIATGTGRLILDQMQWPDELCTEGQILKMSSTANILECAADDAGGLTQEQVEDYAGAMVAGNTETLITVTYQDADGTVDYVVDNDLANYSNATSGFITDYTVTEGDVTAHEAALAITESQITDLGTYVVSSGHTMTGALTTVGAPGLIIGNGATSAGMLQLNEDSDNGTNNVTISAPSALAADTDYVLPADDGDSGDQLTTNGSGVLTWEVAGSGGSGDSVSIDGAGVTDPDFVSTGDIDFVDTSNTITANINADSIVVADVADGDWGDFTVSSNVASLDANTVGDSELASTEAIEFLIDGGGSTITTGVAVGAVEVPFACTITDATVLADQSGSIVVDIWADSYANYPPTDADSITASAPPTISTATKSTDATLTGWTTALSAGDILYYNVDSATTIEWALVSLTCTR